jgi:acetyl-CoA synthetase
MTANGNVLVDHKEAIKALTFPPGKASKNAHVSFREQYDQLYKESIEDPDKFWSTITKSFFWKKEWTAPVRRSDAA